mmetsp:Transcript_27501/g.57773  ORF Transcript_27501/g.57773 Transcript_27501/m.57773 type:complete len:812 (-) Transcript_27501:446-2881(-)
MSLPGDSEIDSLLAMMGGSHHPVPSTSSAQAPTKGKSKTRKRRKETKQLHTVKSKSKRNRTKHDDENISSKLDNNNFQDAVDNKPTSSLSFAETRLTQNCFLWPCTNNGRRWLCLGAGLAHDCSGYDPSVSADAKDDYGSASCLTCGESSAVHTLEFADDGNQVGMSCSQSSLLSIASIITSARNARCLIGEYHPLYIGKRATPAGILPQLKSTPCCKETISKSLDDFVASVLGLVKAIADEVSKDSTKSKRRKKKTQRHPNTEQMKDSDNILRSTFPLSGENVAVLLGKASDLVKASMEYKQAMNVASCLNSDNNHAIKLVETRLVAIKACDAVYYRCYYAAMVASNLMTKSPNDFGDIMAAMIPHPPTYFTCPGLSWDVHVSGVASLRIFLGDEEQGNNPSREVAAPLDASTREMLLNAWGLKKRFASKIGKITDNNPLLCLWQSRFLESIRHIWVTRYSAHVSPLALRRRSNKSPKSITFDYVQSNNDPDAQVQLNETKAISDAVGQWRDSLREYPANFYAYAAPTDEALNAILTSPRGESDSLSYIVEAGAGTGYWSALLRSRSERDAGNVMFPYDVTPPSCSKENEYGPTVMSNEYHGQASTFTDVFQAASFDHAMAQVGIKSSCSLMLCYPPPGCDMALSAVSAHMANDGKIIFHIGEWQGLTGNSAFEKLLTQNFHCNEKDIFALPPWGTDATYLTIWKRNNVRGEENEEHFRSQAFGFCSFPKCDHKAVRRCRFARCVQYCSKECFESHRHRRNAILALHMIELPSCLDFEYEDDDHFLHLRGCHPTFENAGHGQKSKKRRKK